MATCNFNFWSYKGTYLQSSRFRKRSFIYFTFRMLRATNWHRSDHHRSHKIPLSRTLAVLVQSHFWRLYRIAISIFHSGSRRLLFLPVFHFCRALTKPLSLVSNHYGSIWILHPVSIGFQSHQMPRIFCFAFARNSLTVIFTNHAQEKHVSALWTFL